MKYGIGAVSRRVIEEAAVLDVHQIVVSRGQSDLRGGYIGLTPEEIVNRVLDISPVTQVIRDHGGPLQGGWDDDGIESFDNDVKIGFNGLHLDVCKLPFAEQADELVRLVERFQEHDLKIEIGGEHTSWAWNLTLLDAVVTRTTTVPDAVVLDTGAHVWADAQVGAVKSPISVELTQIANQLQRTCAPFGTELKMHNADFIGDRSRYAQVVDIINLAPEIGVIETNALLTVLPWPAAKSLLYYAYDTHKWERWFHEDEGTWDAKARCALRYCQLDTYVVDRTVLSQTQEAYVRKCIRDAITEG
jgi:hypothetical protein